MKNLDMVFGKKVLAVEDAEMVGYVLDICFDEKLKYVKGYLVVDEESESELFLSIENVLSYSEDCLVVNSVHDCEVSIDNVTNNPLGKVVYDRNGTNLGRVENIIINDKKIDKLITEKCEIKQKYIFSCGREFIIFSLKKQKKYRNNIKNEKISVLPKVEIMQLGERVSQIAPSKVAINSTMLLNRMVTADIYGMNSELLIKKGEIINQNYINKAKKHNKLNYLFFNSI